MFVRTLAEDGLTRENNCDLRRIYPWPNVVVPPWNSSIVSIRPQESSKEHNHATDETFIFTSGAGTVRVGAEQRDIEVGDVIYIPHGINHVVTNTSETEPLVFLSVYWLQKETTDA